MTSPFNTVPFQGAQGQLCLDESLSAYTTWRVGGKALRLYKPAGIDDLALFMKHQDKDEPLLWLGLGSNSLIRDGGFQGTVIVTQACLKNIQLTDLNEVKVDAGVSCATMARFCARHHLAGGEFWAGIPGTMGGALKMNAGCFNGETWDRVVEVTTVDRQGRLHVRTPDTFQISYRHVDGLNDEWFVSGTFKLDAGNKETSMEQIRQLLAHRANTQPTGELNCGSVFKNPQGHYAAKLIEQCGLKGQRIGGAAVSEKHANFIINQNGTASAKDIESLIVQVKSTVQEKMQVTLEHEVHIVGAY